MIAVLHCLITDIENTRIRYNLLIWRSKKNFSKFNKLILEQINIFKYFTPRVSLYLSHKKKINNKGYCWGRNW